MDQSKRLFKSAVPNPPEHFKTGISWLDDLDEKDDDSATSVNYDIPEITEANLCNDSHEALSPCTQPVGNSGRPVEALKTYPSTPAVPSKSVLFHFYEPDENFSLSDTGRTKSDTALAARESSEKSEVPRDTRSAGIKPYKENNSSNCAISKEAGLRRLIDKDRESFDKNLNQSFTNLTFPEPISDDSDSVEFQRDSLNNNWPASLEGSIHELPRNSDDDGIPASAAHILDLDYHRDSYDSPWKKFLPYPSILSDDSWKAPESWGTSLPTEAIPKQVFTTRFFARPSLGNKKKEFFLRVYRDDRTSVSFICPIGIQTHEVIKLLARLFFLPSSANFYLLLIQFNTERILLPHEQPCIIFERLLSLFGCKVTSDEEINEEDNYSVARLVFTTMDIGADVLRKFSEKKITANLDISRSNLEVIPVKIYPYAHELISLNVSHNLSLDLPLDFMERCVKLKRLDISNNLRSPRGKPITALRQLEVLNMSRNDIYELDPLIFSGLSRNSLKELNIANNKLFFLPHSTRYLVNLTYLDLSYNNFVTFPLIITELSQLETLNFSHNLLSQISSKIGSLVKLKHLYLQFNDLSNRLPQEIGLLKNLETIDLSYNAITNIASLSECPKLNSINVACNLLSFYEYSNPSATFIDFSFCPLTTIDPAFSYSNLVYFDISHAKLIGLKDSVIETLVNVETLKVNYNHITSISDAISAMQNLKYLSCTNCEMSYVSPNLGKLKHLVHLDLHANNIKIFPEEVWQVSSLKVVNLSSNILEKIKLPVATSKKLTRTISQLKIMRTLSGNPVSSLSSQEFVMPTVEELYLVDNRLGNDCFTALEYFKCLKVLNLSYNYLTEIPSKFFQNFSDLKHLFVSGNELANLSISSTAQVLLETLYANGNRLSSFPKNEALSKSLRFLDISTNNLQNLAVEKAEKKSLTKLPQLEYLNLSGNTWFRFSEHEDTNFTKSYLKNLKFLSIMDLNTKFSNAPSDVLNHFIQRNSPQPNILRYGVCGYLSRSVPVISACELVVNNFLHPQSSLYCVLDSDISAGKNNRVLKFVYDNLASCLAHEINAADSSSEQICNALRRGFLRLNKKLGNVIHYDLRKSSEGDVDSNYVTTMNISEKGYSMDSSCLDIGVSIILVYVRDTRAFVANVGTSMAIMSTRNDSEPTTLSVMHDVYNRDEIRRIVDSCGFISGEIKSTTTRAIGRLSQFPGVQAVPYVNVQYLSELNEFIILANQEFWSVLSKRTVIDVVRANRHSPLLASTKLRDYAIAYGAEKNVLVVIVELNGLFEENSLNFNQLRGDEKTLAISEKNDNMSFVQDLPDDSSLARMNREVSPPKGCIAMVFTDIKNSTLLWERHPIAMRSAIKTHNTIMRRQLRATGGYEVKTEGDAFMVCFQTVPAALLWCFSVQLQLLSADWPNEIVESVQGRLVLGSKNEVLYRGLSVRIGVNYGVTVSELDPITRRMDYYGPVVNRTSRVVSVADGGQIAVSAEVVSVLNQLDSETMSSEKTNVNEMEVRALKQIGYIIHNLGEFKLKGLDTTEMISLVYPVQLQGRLERLIKSRSLGTPTALPETQTYTPVRSRSNSLRPMLARLSDSKSVHGEEGGSGKRSVSSLRNVSPSESTGGYEGCIFDDQQYQLLYELCERLEDHAAILHGFPEPPPCDTGLAAPVNQAEEYSLFYRLTLRIENTIYCVSQMLGHTG